jgi:type IV pilus assembly protein PilA
MPEAERRLERVRPAMNRKTHIHGADPKQRGFSLIELLVVIAIILIIAAIAIPNLLRAKISANQAAAVATVRVLATASTSYSTAYNDGFPASFAVLGGTGATSCNNAELIDPLLGTAPNQKSGYQYGYSGQEGNIPTPVAGCAPGFSGYLITAVPILYNVTGSLSYCTTEQGVISYDTSGALATTDAACTALPSL